MVFLYKILKKFHCKTVLPSLRYPSMEPHIVSKAVCNEVA